jgi:hypothetical protein
MSHPIHDAAFLVVFLGFWIVPAVLTARLAARRGRSFGVFLIIALLVGWPIILIVTLIMPARDKRTDAEPGSQ